MFKKIKKAVGGKSKSKKDVTDEQTETGQEAEKAESTDNAKEDDAPDLVVEDPPPPPDVKMSESSKKKDPDTKMSESSKKKDTDTKMSESTKKEDTKKGDKTSAAADAKMSDSSKGKQKRTGRPVTKSETSWKRNDADNRSRSNSASPGRNLSRSASPSRDLSPSREKSQSASPSRGVSPSRGGKKKTVTKLKKTVSKKSKWEEGIALIDELLVVDSKSYNAMTELQRKGLVNVKNLLLNRDVSQPTTTSSGTTSLSRARSIEHVPRDLILEQRKEQKRRQRAIFPKNQPRRVLNRADAMTSLKRGSTYFILQEYAGVKTDDPLLSDEPVQPRRGKNPNKLKTPATRGASPPPRPPQARLSDGGQTEADLYTPQEFKDLTKEEQKRLCELLSWGSISSWGFDIFELNELTKGNPLLFMGWAVLGAPYAQSAMKQASWNVLGDSKNDSGYTFMDDLKIPPHKLCNYLRVIQEDYQDNPYHNKVHAGDVVQSLHCFIQMALKSDNSFLKNCTNIQLFAILLAACVHDVDHPGKNNAFQTKLKTELAVVYNDMSVLENWHIACAFARMLDLSLLQANIHASQVVHAKLNHEHRDAECNILGQATADEFDTIRNLMIEAVLHTDMSKHFAMVDNAKGMIMTINTVGGENGGDSSNAGLAWNALMFMLHMADISNQAKPGTLARVWTDRCMSEFFAQGDQEANLGVPISPNCDRNLTALPESQVGFIKFVVQPAYEALGDLIPGVKDTVLPMVQSNLDHWLKEKEIEEGSLAPDDGDLSDDDLMSIDGSNP